MGGSEGPVDEPGNLSVPVGIVHDITMPKLGETVTEGTIGSWLKAAGDAIEMDDPLFEVSTDKVDSEIPSPYDGVLLEILVPAGETVPVGTPLARIGEAGTAAPAPSGSTPDAVSAPAPARRMGPATAGPMARPTAPLRLPGPAGESCCPRWSAGWPPRTPWMSNAIAGTGVGGRIRREDVEKALGRWRHEDTGTTRPRPLRRRAGSPQPAAAPAPAAAKTQPIPAGTNDPRDETVTLSRMRLAVAGGMMASLANSASVWTSIEVDFDNVEKIRRKYKDQFKKETGASLSYLPFVSRATIDALRAFPTVNSSIDIEAKTMTLHPYVNLGIAVDLDQQGLVVPVVKDADGLNMRGVAKRITELAGRGPGQEAGLGGHEGFDVHHHEPRSVRQLRVIADHQPAERGDPVHGRCQAAAGGRRRRHRHPSDRHHRPGLRPPGVRRVDGIAVPDAHPGLPGTAQLGARGPLTIRVRIVEPLHRTRRRRSNMALRPTSGHEPVTVTVARTVAVGREAEFEDWSDELTAGRCELPRFSRGGAAAAQPSRRSVACGLPLRQRRTP